MSFECPICYKALRLAGGEELLCKHRFCVSCLDQLFKAEPHGIRCPLCRRTSDRRQPKLCGAWCALTAAIMLPCLWILALEFPWVMQS